MCRSNWNGGKQIPELLEPLMQAYLLQEQPSFPRT